MKFYRILLRRASEVMIMLSREIEGISVNSFKMKLKASGFKDHFNLYAYFKKLSDAKLISISKLKEINLTERGSVIAESLRKIKAVLEENQP